MESGGLSEASPAQGGNTLVAGARRRTGKHRPGGGVRVRHIQTYRLCEIVTEGLIYLMVVFGPWAFGTTQTWAIWTMNVAGYTLGLLLAIKYSLRGFTPYRPARWGSGSSQPITVLAGLTVVLLGYTLVSALNAQASYSAESLTFTSHPFISWLPHSLDGTATWFTFWTYLGLAASFWAVRDWLLGKTEAEARVLDGGEDRARRTEDGEQRTEDRGWKIEDGKRTREDRGQGPVDQSATCNLQSAIPGGSQLSAPSSILHPPSSQSFPLPGRLRRLLWLLVLNGAILGLEGIVQRLANCPKLLFLVQPRINSMVEAQFGPYAYRSNAAQYFNLLWPVCLGFWWILNRSADRRQSSHHLVLASAGIMAACPIISTTRAGSGVMVAMLLVAVVLLLVMELRTGRRHRRGSGPRLKTLQPFLLFALGALVLGLGLGYKALLPRLGQLEEGYQDREELYQVARRIADEYPLFGTGPGTYESVSAFYRPDPNVFFPAQVHNDFLETLVTFGWVGSVFVYFALFCVFVRWFMPGGIHGGRRFVLLIWLALAGCFAQARFDFPFQIHSVLFLFLVLCAVLSVLTRRG